MPRKNPADSLFNESLVDNKLSWMQYYNRLTELAISMFEWQNLPDTIDERFLELGLFSEGQMLFFKDDELSTKNIETGEMNNDGYLCLRTMIGGKWDVYNIPMERTAYASNGYNAKRTNKDSVIIYNNMIHTNSTLDVEVFAKRLYNLDRAIDVNANAQKTPILIKCDENQRLTMKNLYMQYNGNAPFIFGAKSLNANDLTVLKTDAPYVADKLYALKTQIWNEALTYLGISNVNFQKKERLISDEVTRNMGGIIASRYSRLQSRRLACEKINQMFGLDIEVNYREDFRETDDEFIIEGESGDSNKINASVLDLRSTSAIRGTATGKDKGRNE